MLEINSVLWKQFQYSLCAFGFKKTTTETTFEFYASFEKLTNLPIHSLIFNKMLKGWNWAKTIKKIIIQRNLYCTNVMAYFFPQWKTKFAIYSDSTHRTWWDCQNETVKKHQNIGHPISVLTQHYPGSL